MRGNCDGDLAVQVLVKLLHDLLESLQVVLHIVLGHDQAQVELGEGRLQKLVVHLPDLIMFIKSSGSSSSSLPVLS